MAFERQAGTKLPSVKQFVCIKKDEKKEKKKGKK